MTTVVVETAVVAAEVELFGGHEFGRKSIPCLVDRQPRTMPEGRMELTNLNLPKPAVSAVCCSTSSGPGGVLRKSGILLWRLL